MVSPMQGILLFHLLQLRHDGANLSGLHQNSDFVGGLNVPSEFLFDFHLLLQTGDFASQ